MDEIIENEIADISGMTINEVLDLWDNEMLKLELLMKKEATRIYKWGGGEFKLGKGYIDEYKKQKQDEAMKKPKAKIIPSSKLLSPIKRQKTTFR